MKLSLSDIQQCFIYTDHLGFKRPGEGELFEKFTEAEWFEIFADLSKERFTRAYKLAVNKLRYWPKPIDVFEMLEYVKESPPKVQQLMAPPVKRDISQERIQKLMEAVKTGRAQEWLKEHMEPEVREYAKELYPEMSEELIIRNYGPFSYLHEKHEYPDRYRREPFLDSQSGYVEIRVIA